jgi:hypothetical protein
MATPQPARLPTRTRPALALSAIALLGALGLAGCTSAEKTLVEGTPFPADLKQARTLNIQVTRNGTDISLTNTTDLTLTGRLWANQWWSRTIEPMAPAQRVTLDLRTFLDKYNTPFNAGGFFSTQPADKLVQLQLQTDAELLGLLVVTPLRD